MADGPSKDYPGWGLDGAALHSPQGGVPPELWCVSRADLSFLRARIAKEIAAGTIVPSDRDAFHLNPQHIGPSMYTVVASYVKPLTERAGRMSWALLRHPDGLACDVFITHCWAEGAFEFIDKVLASWPFGKLGAWCCILANPQNLDISSMISDPLSSPFARALRAATHVMVAPTQQSSIYSRIWCIYEAYLAVECGSTVYTAVSPLKCEARRVVAGLVIAVLGFATGYLALPLGVGVDHAIWIVIWCMCVLTQLLARYPRVSLVINGVGWFFSTLAPPWFYRWNYYHLPNHGSVGDTIWSGGIWILFALYFLASEVDRLRVIRNYSEARQLKSGYSGVFDAQASVEEDKLRILQAIGGDAHHVDNSITVLIASGMSTADLRAAAALRVDLRGAANMRLSVVYLGFTAWATSGVYPTDLVTHVPPAVAWTYMFVNLSLLALCLAVFVQSEVDEKAFIAMSVAKLQSVKMFWGLLYALEVCRKTSTWWWTTFFAAALLAAVAGTAFALLGRRHLVRAPRVGPWVVQLLGPGSGCFGAASGCQGAPLAPAAFVSAEAGPEPKALGNAEAESLSSSDADGDGDAAAVSL